MGRFSPRRYANGSDRLALMLPTVWDVELCATLGRRNMGCPYFASRTAHEAAQVVFSPYSYLVDPVSSGSLTFAIVLLMLLRWPLRCYVVLVEVLIKSSTSQQVLRLAMKLRIENAVVIIG